MAVDAFFLHDVYIHFDGSEQKLTPNAETVFFMPAHDRLSEIPVV